GAIQGSEIVDRAGLVELLLDRCLDPVPFPDAPADPDSAVAELLEVAARVLATRQEAQPAI
ncbi:MAG TPA: hypothetical protein VFR35_14955, partial [Actinoplanes sp.]|nr:hypothetical protein [Actinoplanes sp.]